MPFKSWLSVVSRAPQCSASPASTRLRAAGGSVGSGGSLARRPWYGLNPFRLHRVLATRLAGVARGFGFQQEHPHLRIGLRTVLHPVGDHNHFAFLKGQVAVAQLDDQPALDHQEEFVFGRVGVPNELASQFGQFDVAAVQFRSSQPSGTTRSPP